MLLVSHPTGNSFVRHLLAGLVREGLLAEFWTTIATERDRIPRLLPDSLRAALGRRAYPPDVLRRTRTRPWRELIRLCIGTLGLSGGPGQGRFSIDTVYEGIDRAAARRVRRAGTQFRGVYCYEDGALRTFEAARDRGLSTFYELPIAYYETAQRLYREEADRLPQWAHTLTGCFDEPGKLERKRRELELADAVICPSRFVVDSLPPDVVRNKRVVLARFGSPEMGTVQDQDADAPAPDSKLRVLFAGSLTQRKGLADLLEAIRLLNRRDVELVVMGTPVAPLEYYTRIGPRFTYEAPRAQDELWTLMRSCHVLVLPSLVEGRALVVQEAMACGLPIIITPNTGCADLVVEGKTGFIVPIRDPPAIGERIAWFAEHRAQWPIMSRHARQAAAAITWNHYQATVTGVIRDLE